MSLVMPRYPMKLNSKTGRFDKFNDQFLQFPNTQVEKCVKVTTGKIAREGLVNALGTRQSLHVY